MCLVNTRAARVPPKKVVKGWKWLVPHGKGWVGPYYPKKVHVGWNQSKKGPGWHFFRSREQAIRFRMATYIGDLFAVEAKGVRKHGWQRGAVAYTAEYIRVVRQTARGRREA